MKVLIVLCLGVVAVQAFPKRQASPSLKDEFDDLIKELDILNSTAVIEQTNATEVLTDVLSTITELSVELKNELKDDLIQASGILAQQVYDLEKQASDYDVDISECIGDLIVRITTFIPLSWYLMTDICAIKAQQRAESTLSHALINVDLILAPIDEYLGQIQQCRDSDPTEQETCITKLSTEIKNDQIQIPVNIRLAVDETLGYLERDNSTLGRCFVGAVNQSNKEGETVVANITECAERLFPTIPPTHLVY